MRRAGTWILVGIVLAWTPTILGHGQEGRPSAPTTLMSDGRSLSSVTVERHGPLLVLSYGLKSADGKVITDPGPRGEPRRFTIYKGRHKIASGSFEYG